MNNKKEILIDQIGKHFKISPTYHAEDDMVDIDFEKLGLFFSYWFGDSELRVTFTEKNDKCLCRYEETVNTNIIEKIKNWKNEFQSRSWRCA